MDRLRAADLGGEQDRGLVQIALRRARPARCTAPGRPGGRGSRRGRPRECAATVRRPRPRQARWMRSAISPRLAIRTVSNIGLIDQAKRSSGWPASTSCPEATSTASTVASRSARTSLKTFIASMTHRVWPALTACPTARTAARRARLQVDDAVRAERGSSAGRGLGGLDGVGTRVAGQPMPLRGTAAGAGGLGPALRPAHEPQRPAVLAELHLGEVRGCHRIDECLDLLRVHAPSPGSRVARTRTYRHNSIGTGRQRQDGLSLPR